MITECPVSNCGHPLVFDPHLKKLRCPKGHGPVEWKCSVCKKPLDVVSVKQYGGVALVAPSLDYLRCPDGHGGNMQWFENCRIFWEEYETDEYYYFYVKDRGGNGDLLPFPQGISLSRTDPDAIRCYIRGDRVSGSVAAVNSIFREMASFDSVPRTPANEAAIRYIVQEMAAVGFLDVWHPKDGPWYEYSFYSEYPQHPYPPDWHQRMERVR